MAGPPEDLERWMKAPITRLDKRMADEKKKDTPAKAKPEAKPDAKPEAKPEAKPDAPAEASKNYSRGEGQKAVTQAYKDNWNAIFGKKKKR
jgi:hypothetical protein